MGNKINLSELNKINWKEKLSSRKLWIGIVLVVIGVVLCLTGDVDNGIRIAAIGGGVYLGAETIVDVMRIIFVQGKDTADQTEKQSN